MGKIIDRLSGKTPTFFRKLRNIGIAIATVGSVLIAAPVALPAVVVTVGGYLVTAGGVVTAVSQLANIGEDAVGENGGSDGAVGPS
jgi:hypothetical protein